MKITVEVEVFNSDRCETFIAHKLRRACSFLSGEFCWLFQSIVIWDDKSNAIPCPECIAARKEAS